eukprot:Amastigsp_a514509_9.p5 type:complete len:123 gc:universal Amastigsp_a514509_9:450-818(+)
MEPASSWIPNCAVVRRISAIARCAASVCPSRLTSGSTANLTGAMRGSRRSTPSRCPGAVRLIASQRSASTSRSMPSEGSMTRALSSFRWPCARKSKSPRHATPHSSPQPKGNSYSMSMHASE